VDGALSGNITKGRKCIANLVHGFRVGSSDFIYLVTARFDHLYNLNVALVLVIHAAWRVDWLPPLFVPEQFIVLELCYS
jgi:hypothetical protein